MKALHYATGRTNPLIYLQLQAASDDPIYIYQT